MTTGQNKECYEWMKKKKLSDEQARRRLRSKQPARRSLTDDESSFEATETRGDDCGDQRRRDRQDCSRREAGSGTGAQIFMRASGQQGVLSLLRLRAWKISKWRERCC